MAADQCIEVVSDRDRRQDWYHLGGTLSGSTGRPPVIVTLEHDLEAARALDLGDRPGLHATVLDDINRIAHAEVVAAVVGNAFAEPSDSKIPTNGNKF